MTTVLAIQSLDVVSVNLWQMLISICNLLIIFLIIKKFLFKPVKAAMDKRQAAVDKQYDDAAKAKSDAESSRSAWEAKLATADDTADGIIRDAEKSAKLRGENVIADAKEKADDIIRRAEEDAALSRRRAEKDIKKEIADVSVALTGKLLEKEISEDDQRRLIDSFIGETGENNEPTSYRICRGSLFSRERKKARG